MRTATAQLAAALLLIALCGCGTEAGVLNAQSANAVAQSVEQGGRFIALVGPRRQHDEPFLGVPDTNFYRLRSWLDTRTGESVTQLYVEDSYFGAERNWEAARDAQGQKLRFIPISKNEITCTNGCSYAEEFAAALPDAPLRQSPNGLAVSFTAQSGAEQTIIVPANLVEAQFAAIAAVRAALPTAAAPPPANPSR